jgi:hypothetical protein
MFGLSGNISTNYVKRFRACLSLTHLVAGNDIPNRAIAKRADEQATSQTDEQTQIE